MKIRLKYSVLHYYSPFLEIAFWTTENEKSSVSLPIPHSLHPNGSNMVFSYRYRSLAPTASVAQQFLRCVFYQLAPSRLFPELFRVDNHCKLSLVFFFCESTKKWNQYEISMKHATRKLLSKRFNCIFRSYER